MNILSFIVICLSAGLIIIFFKWIYGELRFLILKFIMKDKLIFRYEDIWHKDNDQEDNRYKPILPLKTKFYVFITTICLSYPFVFMKTENISFRVSINKIIMQAVEGAYEIKYYSINNYVVQKIFFDDFNAKPPRGMR